MHKGIEKIEQDDNLDDGRAWAVLKPGFVVRGYGTHTFTFGTRAEFRTKSKFIEPCDCDRCKRESV
jgi:hypothetical protein